jgi:hypothetical protein
MAFGFSFQLAEHVLSQAEFHLHERFSVSHKENTPGD